MKSVLRWLCVTAGLTALWMTTRAVAFYFVGVIALFATAFQATVDALSRIGAESDSSDEALARPAPDLRVHRDARLAASIVDLTAVETPQQSVL